MAKKEPRKLSLRIWDWIRDPSFWLDHYFGPDDDSGHSDDWWLKNHRKLRLGFLGPNSTLNWVEGFLHTLGDYILMLPLTMVNIILKLFFKFKLFTFPIFVIGFLVLLLFYPFIQMMQVFGLIVVVIITLLCILGPLVAAFIYEPFKKKEKSEKFWMFMALIMWVAIGFRVAMPIFGPYMSSLICPPGYENVIVQTGTRAFDMPGQVVSFNIITRCAGEAGRYTPLFYHLALVMTGAYLAWWGFLYLGGRLVTGYIWRNRKPYKNIRRWIIAAFAVAGMAVLLAIPANVPAVGRSVFAVLQVGRGGGGGIDGRLFNPILEGDLPKVRALLEQGASPNSRDAVTYQTALHRAVIPGDAEVVELLLKRGADPNVRSGPREKRQPGRGQLPLSRAIEFKRWKIARLLVENGADLNAFGENMINGSFGFTALFQAVVKKNVEMVRYLLEKGADPNRGLKDFRRPLHQSVRNYIVSIEITRLLLKAGADPNLVTRSGTPLNYLVDTAPWDIARMKVLLTAGADINGKDQGGRTALMVASKPRAITFLLEAGADPRAVDAQGKSVLEYQSRSKERTQLIQKALKGNAGR